MLSTTEPVIYIHGMDIPSHKRQLRYDFWMGNDNGSFWLWCHRCLVFAPFARCLIPSSEAEQPCRTCSGFLTSLPVHVCVLFSFFFPFLKQQLRVFCASYVHLICDNSSSSAYTNTHITHSYCLWRSSRRLPHPFISKLSYDPTWNYHHTSSDAMICFVMSTKLHRYDVNEHEAKMK